MSSQAEPISMTLKTFVLGLLPPKRYRQISSERKRGVIELVLRSLLPKWQTLAESGLPRSIYHR